MAQKRIEWACPKCSKRFAIPANANLPERCPDCQQSASQKEEIKIKSPPPVPTTETPLPHFEEMESVEVPSIAVPAQQRNRTSNKNLPRQYPALRLISLGYRVLGWFLFGATLLCNLLASSFLLNENVQVFLEHIGYHVALLFVTNIMILLTGSFFALIAFASAELIILFIDIEENTRERRKR